ncbi:hypothetical protein V493_01542 [Pseudogymnoascus sp. VKM F-4281 (FW-2241)]|nr:hypothetical protein V493_01542 [Pseudogymnoascus sp. VKM F-4281 (FW-2241)]
MSTPIHPHAVWNPAFRPDSSASLPPVVAIATTDPSHPSNTYLHNVTPFSAAAAAKFGADADLKLVPLGDYRDLEAGVVTTKQMGVKARVEGWWKWFAWLMLMFITASLGTCFVAGG